MSYQFAPTDAPVKNVTRVEFGILSPEEIIAQSVVKVEHEVLYENKEPKVGSLSDVRMGCIDKNMDCYTCKETINNCPGHFGHIELNVPVYHIQFIKVVKKILECVCHQCARFRLLETDHRYRKLLHVKEKFKYACENAKSKMVCEYSDCETQLLPLRRSGISLYYDPKKIDKKMGKIPLPAAEAREILERIPDDRCKLIGLDPIHARPEWMIITVLPVPPPCVRPSITVDSNGRSEDDLTHMLTNIIKYNNLVKRHENSRSAADFKEQLQVHVTTYIDNDISGIDPVLQKGGRPIKSLSARLKGKDGLIRGHLMGKRVDFSARTVITGDPNISIEEVGVPYSIAKNLTFPEKVFPGNMGYLQRLVDNSPSYPGAKFVIRADNGNRIDLQFCTRKPILKVGDVVERHMRDGDIVLFNRQPTLHKMSMMAHRARVMTGSTFRLNVNICSSYNADFDGDEMNVHMCQSYSTQAELMTLSRVSQLLVSAQGNKPVNALVQDALCGIRQLTRRDVFLTKDKFFNLLMWLRPWNGNDGTGYDGGKQDDHGKIDIPPPAIMKPVPMWTGKQLLSMMLPPIHLTGYHSIHGNKLDVYKKYLDAMQPPLTPEERQEKIDRWLHENPEDTRVLIENGELLTGIICKRTAGSAAGSIVHVIWNDFGPEAAKSFMDNAAQIIVQWMLMEGFSIGLGDGLISPDTIKSIQNVIDEQYKKAEVVINMYRNGELLPQGNMTVEETKENKLQEILAKARDSAGSMANASLRWDNNIKQMVEAGSKGSALNICQIAACVGQQIVDGGRIPYGYHKKTLPHYDKLDDSPEARGFVRNSFIKGLLPQEVFFHAMGGREGLIDTSIRTAETGYIQRRLIKAVEDLCIKYDGTVRNSKNDVIQFFYGEDGFDGTSIENQNLDTMLMNNDDFYHKYHVSELNDTEWKLLCTDREFLRNTMRIPDDRWALPLNLKRIVKRATTLFPNKSKNAAKKLSYSDVFDATLRLRKSLQPSKLDTSHKKKINKNNEISTGMGMGISDVSYTSPSTLFGINLSSVLSSKQVVDRYKMSKEAFDWAINEVSKKYYSGLIQAGESVGIVAAQSIGEPATQMTLNVFHLSGTGNKAVTSGIPRLKELINAVKNLKTPGMTVYLKENVRMDQTKARKVKCLIEHCTVTQLIDSFDIIYDPDYTNSTLQKDRNWLDIINSIPDDDAPAPRLLHPWVMRMVLSRKMMIEKDLSIYDVAGKIEKAFGEDFYILHSDDNNVELVIHLRMFKDPEDVRVNEPFDEHYRNQESTLSARSFFDNIKSDFLSSITVTGIPGIDKAFISQKPVVEYDESGALNMKRKEFVIETDGINMKDVIKIPGVDSNRIYCNDPQEMMTMFGVEVARNTLLEEIRHVIESGGSYINYRHLCLLCDVMTNRGQIMSITRHGINKTDAGPLTKCTFEQTVDILMDAAVYGEADNVNGVAENIMMGQIAPIGTGMMDILTIEDVYRKHQASTDDEGYIMDDYDDYDDYDQFVDEDGKSYKRSVQGGTEHGDKIMQNTIVERDSGEEYCPLKPSYLR